MGGKRRQKVIKDYLYTMIGPTITFFTRARQYVITGFSDRILLLAGQYLRHCQDGY